jgi:very-short-patch-repair endonuclease
MAAAPGPGDRWGMATTREFRTDLDQAFQDGVLTTRSALARMTPDALQWRIESGRWQQPCRGVVVAHSGPLTTPQQLWVACLWAGPGAALGGLTAARLWGLRGFDANDDAIQLILPPGRERKVARPPLRLITYYSRHLTGADVHPARQPPRTRVARSLVDAAAWRYGDRGAQAVLAAGVQQGLVLPGHLTGELDRNRRVHRRKLMSETISDIAGGCGALSELDFLRNVIRPHRLPEPDRQVPRADEAGRRRWLDAVWEKARLIVEVDGAGHADILQYWKDMDRDNQQKLSGYDTLRYASFAVRYHADYVAGQIRQVLRDRGMQC